jgi:hypothetical protein
MIDVAPLPARSRLTPQRSLPDFDLTTSGLAERAMVLCPKLGERSEAARVHCIIGRHGGMAIEGERTIRTSPADRRVGA